MIKIKISHLLYILIYLIGSNGQRTCSNNRNLVKFNEQFEYVYSFEIDTIAKIRPNDKLSTNSLILKSEIRLNKKSDCIYSLRFDKIKYDQPANESDLDYRNKINQIRGTLENSFYFKIIDGEIKNLNFTFHFKDEKLNEWTRKLYENLFLTLQLPINDDFERDEEITLSREETFDQCEISYKVKYINKVRSFYEIKSIKNDLDNCLKRKKNNFLINSIQECNHQVQDNQLFEVHCVERNKANLLYAEQTINTKLKFLRTDQKKNDLIELPVQKNEIEVNKTLDANLVESSRNQLHEICDQLKIKMESKITRSILNLSENIMKLNYNQLIDLIEYSNGIDECKDRKQFRDILNSIIIQQGNSAAIQYLLEHTDQPTDMFYSLLAFSKKPKKDAVNLIIPKLIDQLNRPIRSYQPILGMTSYLGNYCEQENCEQNDQIIRLQRRLIDKLGDKCSNRRHQILFLKCIQNIGLLEQIIDDVLPCLDMKISSIIRSTTLQLLEKSRTIINNKRTIDKLIEIFSDPHQKNELRINSFLILMKVMKSNYHDEKSLRNHLINHLNNERNLQGNYFF